MKRRLWRCHESIVVVVPQPIIEHFSLKIGDVLDFRIDDHQIKAIPVADPTKSKLQATTPTLSTAESGINE